MKREHGLRAAINTPIQGGAADIVIAAMVKLHKDEKLKDLGYKLLLQIHDEVILVRATTLIFVGRAGGECILGPQPGRLYHGEPSRLPFAGEARGGREDRLKLVRGKVNVDSRDSSNKSLI